MGYTGKMETVENMPEMDQSIIVGGWSKLADGQVWKLTQGADFSVPCERVIRSARQWAGIHQMAFEGRRNSRTGVVYVRFT